MRTVVAVIRRINTLLKGVGRPVSPTKPHSSHQQQQQPAISPSKTEPLQTEVVRKEKERERASEGVREEGGEVERERRRVGGREGEVKKKMEKGR